MLFAAFLVCVEAIRMELAANSNVARRLISPLNSDDGAAKRPAAQDVPWGWIAGWLMALLQEYQASGVTRTIALAEIELKLEDMINQRTRGIAGKFISIKDIKSSAPSSSSSTFDSSALFECQIEAHQTLPNTKTILLGFTNHNGNGCVEGVEMYLHNKFALLANSLEFDGAGFAFLEKRKIRMTNVKSNLTTERLKRQIIRLLPCDLIVFMLSRSSPSDTEFINRLCPASHSLAILKALDLNANCSLQSSSFSITATVFEINHPSDKIAHVVLVDQNHYNNRSHLATISTSSQTLPPQPQQTTLFILKNEQCGLASFFKKGDTVIMYQPGMDVDHNNHHRQQHHHQNMIHLLYGPSTILFCIPESSETDKIKNNTSNNHYLTSSASSSLPIIDCTRIPSRILIKDLKPYMTGVTLLGRIEYLSGNYPIANGQVARFGLILADESGSCNITFWGPTASRSCSQLLVGQVILLQNLNIGISITSNENYYKEEDGGGVAGFANNVSVWASFSDDHSFNNNNKKMSSSSLHNLSTCRGILSTPSFMMESRLHSIHETRNLVCKCIVVGIRDVSSNGVIHAHDTCKRPIKLDPQGTRICEFCAEYINNGSMADETYTFHIIVEICDGVSGLSAAVSHQAAIDIVGVTPRDYFRMSKRDRDAVLARCLGKEFIMSVSKLPNCVENFNNGEYRIDAVAVPSTCAERIKTLSNLLQLSDHQNNGAARLKSISYNASVGGTSVSSEINPASTTTTTNTAAAAAAAKMHRPAQKRKSGDGVMGMDAVSVEAHQFPEITPPKTKHLKGSGIAFGGGVGGLNSWHSAKNTTTTTAAAAAGLKRSTSNPAVDNLHSQHHLNEQSHRQQRTMSSTSVFQQPKQNQSLTRSNSSSSILPSSNTTTNNNNNSSSSSFENNSNNTSRTTKMFVGDNSSLVPKAPPIQTKSTSAAGPHVVNNNKIPLARAKSNTFSTTIKSTSALSLVPTGSSQQPLLSQSARSSGGKATIAKRLGMTHRNPTSLISATTTTNNNRDSLSSITSSSASPAESKPVSSSKKTLLRRKL